MKKGADDLADENKVTINNEDGDSAEINADLSSGKNSEDVLEEISEADSTLNIELEKLQAELAAKNDRLLRLQADFDNFRKRSAKEKTELGAMIEQEFLKDLLPLLDNLGRASEASEGENSDAETLRKGIEMIKQETVAALGKHGLEPIDTTDKMFDPNFHQAVGTVQDDTKEDGMIAAEFQRGYVRLGQHSRSDRTARAIKKSFPSDTQIKLGNSGMEIGLILNGKNLMKKLEKSRVAVTPVEADEKSVSVLISCSAIPGKDIKAAIEMLAHDLYPDKRS